MRPLLKPQVHTAWGSVIRSLTLRGPLSGHGLSFLILSLIVRGFSKLLMPNPLSQYLFSRALIFSGASVQILTSHGRWLVPKAAEDLELASLISQGIREVDHTDTNPAAVRIVTTRGSSGWSQMIRVDLSSSGSGTADSLFRTKLLLA